MLFGDLTCPCFDKFLPAALLAVLRDRNWKPAAGKETLIEGKLWISVFETTALPAADREWEAHREFADLQLVLSGSEYCLLADADTCRETKTYDAAGDCVMYSRHTAECQQICLTPGKALLIPPPLVHLPGVEVPSIPGKHLKAVAKIHRSLLA